LGSGALQRKDNYALLSAASQLAHKLRANVDSEDWRVFNILHRVILNYN
jgi:hypothetical protein